MTVGQFMSLCEGLRMFEKKLKSKTTDENGFIVAFYFIENVTIQNILSC